MTSVRGIVVPRPAKLLLRGDFMPLGIGAAMLGSSIIGGASSAFGQKSANDATAASVDKQINFQREMSNTSYQRAMADMKKAGLNPLLASKLGGASTPAGASYQAGNVGSAMVQGASSALGASSQAKQADAQTKQLEAQTEKVAQEISNLQSAKNLTDKQVSKMSHEIVLINRRISESLASESLTRAKTTGQRYQNEYDALLNQVVRSGEFQEVARDIGIGVDKFVDVIRELKAKAEYVFRLTDKENW